jgi:hypothetical protein
MSRPVCSPWAGGWGSNLRLKPNRENPPEGGSTHRISGDRVTRRQRRAYYPLRGKAP